MVHAFNAWYGHGTKEKEGVPGYVDEDLSHFCRVDEKVLFVSDYCRRVSSTIAVKGYKKADKEVLREGQNLQQIHQFKLI